MKIKTDYYIKDKDSNKIMRLNSNPNLSRHTKSQSCLHLQKQLNKVPSSSDNNTFLPFRNQRRLGKLITSSPGLHSPRSSDEQMIEQISFKNFSKVYKMVMQFENRRYSQNTRDPGQRDLINDEWKLKVIQLPNHQSSKEKSLKKSSTGRISMSRRQNVKQKVEKKDKFEKINQHLYKKLSLVRQPTHNPELQDMYENYIKISEMNQNIRRTELLLKNRRQN